MNEVEELHGLESACRLCLTTEETRSSIFGAAFSLDPLIDKIQNCLALHISEEDKLSTLICITCVSKVNQWHQYKKSCLQSQDKLMQWLAKQSKLIADVTVKKEPVILDCAEEIEQSGKKDEQFFESEAPPSDADVQIDAEQKKNGEAKSDNLENALKKDVVNDFEKERDVDQVENEGSLEDASENSESKNEAVVRMEVEQENEEATDECEARETSKETLPKDSDNESKQLGFISVKTEPPDEYEVDENMEAESTSGELLLNPLAMASSSAENSLPEVESTQKSSSSFKGKKKVRRGPHTHFRGTRIFKRKCLYCQIYLHSKASYAKHMARFHSVVAKSIPKLNFEPDPLKPNDLAEETEELIEDVEEELENLEEDAPLTPVQQNIISQLKTFSCYLCEQSFQDRRSTLNHIRQHMPDLRAYTCVACLTEFSDRSSYKQHCEVSFECAMKIALVVPIQGVEKYFTCNMCLRPMSNRKDLLSHLTKHSDKQYEELMAPSSSPPKLTPMAPLPSFKSPSFGPYEKGDPAYNHECDLCGMIYRYKPNMSKHRELCASLQPEGRTSYKCIDCGMTFLVFSKFHNHVTLQHKKKELKCPKCAAKFRSPSDYIAHHEFHRKRNDVKETAQKNWNRSVEEVVEESPQSKGKKFACSLCTQHFISRAELTEHKNLHLKVKIYSCVICRSMFSSAGALEIHMKDHGIDDPTERTANSSCMEYGQEDEGEDSNNSGQFRKNECFDCGKTFSNLANLRRHVRNAHGDDRRIDCAECDRTLKNKESYDEHMRNVHNSLEKTVLTCPQCPKTFVFQANLDLHVRNVHANEERGCHECEICGKTFAEENSLKIHRGWHNRANSRFSLENYDRDRLENSFASSSKPAKARKSFPSTSPVQQQQLIELQCQVCDDKFLDVTELRKHVWDVHCARAAKTEKPFLQGELQCELCTNIFPDQQSLESHMEWHERNPILNDSGNFRCDICDKYYSSRKILWKHKKLHKVSQALKFQSLPVKKPTCNFCGRSFTAESSLKRHKAMSPECQSYYTGRGLADQEFRMEDSAKKRPVTCHICKTVFPSMSVLYQHKQLVHKTHFRDRRSSNEFVPLASVEGVICNVCGKQFTGVSNLKQHFTIKHKNVSKHPCTIANCNMVFSTPHALKNHELTHSNMIYSCSLCERHFFHKAVIDKHILNAHRAVCQSMGSEKGTLYKETDLSTYVVKGATGTVCPRCRVKYPNIKAMKIHYFKFHETFV